MQVLPFILVHHIFVLKSILMNGIIIYALKDAKAVVCFKS